MFSPDNSVTNFVLIGEAGCGKSEIAINLARHLLQRGDKPVHLFDLDMTKPLFRSRDQAATLVDMGICAHFQEQMADTPTIGGGVMPLLRDSNCYTVLDVGGDYMGARAIGGYAPLLNRDDTAVWYVMNPYRPWTTSLERIDQVLSQILGVSHIQLAKLHMVANPNLGGGTSADEIVSGYERLVEMIGEYKSVDLLCVEENLVSEVENRVIAPIFPLTRYLAYPWK